MMILKMIIFYFIYKDYICNRRFNSQTFQLNLSNLADDDGTF